MSAERARSAVEPTHRSILPNIPGVPWWAALVIAVTGTAIGYAIDTGSGHKELTHVFAGLYIAGCLAAVLAVRQEGLFTAIIQPPLILFCAVPGAYWLFHGRKIGHLKDLLINCGYPLIERFPLMLGTAGAVLLIGLVRWYSGTSNRKTLAANKTDERPSATERKSFFGGVSAKLNSYLGLGSADGDADEAASARPRRARASARDAATKTGRAARGDRSSTRSTRTRSRRPFPEDPDQAQADRPRRRRPAPPRDVDPADPPRRSRRRPRPEGDPDVPAQPRESRRDPRTRRNPYERPAPRSSRFDDYDRYEPPGPSERFGRYEPYDPSYEAPRRRGGTGGGSNGADSTHHPISRVRYRGETPLDQPRGAPRAEPRPERRGRSRAHGRSQGRPPADSWEYDV
ncbi:DUF6542 domain-containing protein [Mycobacterium sp. IS-1264]|uniref:DUF6542 domain-containing protein n=1 Tax=Mycobacterium sp. IS-1264 TaxID=1834158 RepID=UPI00197BDD6C|nr:DUF6542 domain-containing protein [Mycobacterium sp. IS-1264]